MLWWVYTAATQPSLCKSHAVVWLPLPCIWSEDKFSIHPCEVLTAAFGSLHCQVLEMETALGITNSDKHRQAWVFRSMLRLTMVAITVRGATTRLNRKEYIAFVPMCLVRCRILSPRFFSRSFALHLASAISSHVLGFALHLASAISSRVLISLHGAVMSCYSVAHRPL